MRYFSLVKLYYIALKYSIEKSKQNKVTTKYFVIIHIISTKMETQTTSNSRFLIAQEFYCHVYDLI